MKITQKMAKIANFRRFLGIGVSATFAEYSVPNIRPISAEYSAEYSVFGRTLSKAEEVEQKEAYNRIVNKCRKKYLLEYYRFGM